MALAGPVAIANAYIGLTPEQIAIVGQEMNFVDASIRDEVTKMWYAAWGTIADRGW